MRLPASNPYWRAKTIAKLIPSLNGMRPPTLFTSLMSCGAVEHWEAAGQLAESATVTLARPEQGPLSLDDVRRIMAHEIERHVADLLLLVSA